MPIESYKRRNYNEYVVFCGSTGVWCCYSKVLRDYRISRIERFELKLLLWNEVELDEVLSAVGNRPFGMFHPKELVFV